ncbi:MAG TPA: hypothetical protein VME45_05765 [Stellaceae bacterium]|nr:hypothetical protein [Stellaceae bacterium]
MAVKLLTVSLAMLCCAASAASACQKTTNPVFEDNFKNADPGWGQPDNVAAFTANGLVLTPPVSGSAWRSNASLTIAQGDWCVREINPPSLPTPANEDTVGAVGVWFWGSDLQNFYTATITLDGKASIDRLNHGIWQTVVPPQAAPAVNTAPNAANEIEIVTSGNTATFFVNGQRITAITAHPPANGGSPGVYAESGPKGTSWTFPRVALY